MRAIRFMTWYLQLTLHSLIIIGAVKIVAKNLKQHGARQMSDIDIPNGSSDDNGPRVTISTPDVLQFVDADIKVAFGNKCFFTHDPLMIQLSRDIKELIKIFKEKK